MNAEGLLSPHLARIYAVVRDLARKEPEVHLYKIATTLGCGLHVLLADLTAFEGLGLVESGSKIATLRLKNPA